MKICTVEGCDRPVGDKGAKGMCPRHYKRRRAGSDLHAIPVQQLPLEDRFARSFTPGKPDECWEWTAASDKQGYGVISVDNRSRRATRIQWLLTHGTAVPDDEIVCHRCDNPPCVNPAHLFLGSHLDNRRDAAGKGRARGNPRGVRVQYRLTNAQIDAIRAAGNPYPGARRALAQQYGISQQHVRAIQLDQRRTKPALGL